MDSFNELSQDILDEVIQNGRLSVADCVKSLLQHYKENQSDKKFEEKEILNAVGTLIRANVLVQADVKGLSGFEDEVNRYSLNHGLDKMDFKLPNKMKRKATKNIDEEVKGKKSAKKAKTITTSVNLLKNEALSKEILSKLDQTIPLSEIDAKKNGKKGESMFDEFDHSNPLFVDSQTKEEIIYKLNNRYFINEFRTRMIVNLFLNREQGKTGFVLEALLLENKLTSKASNFKTTEPVAFNDIVKKLGSLPENVIIKCLESLEKEGFVKRTMSKDINHMGTSYTVDMEALIKKLQLKTIERTIAARFDQQYHARIFRMLNTFGYLDEKQLSEKGLMPLKDARAAVYEMVKERICVSQELPGEKGKHIHVYGVKVQQVIENMITEHYKVLHNLQSRQVKEKEDLEELRNTTNNEDKINELHEHIRKIESAILEVDSTLMLFTEF
jgi:hypothetical protein